MESGFFSSFHDRGFVMGGTTTQSEESNGCLGFIIVATVAVALGLLTQSFKDAKQADVVNNNPHEVDAQWRINGRRGLIQFRGR